MKDKKVSVQQWEYWLSRINPRTNELYNETEAKDHVSSFRKWSKFYWTKRINPETNKLYTEDEATIQISIIQKEMSSKSILKNKGKNDISETQYNYWINKHGYSESDAKEIVSKRQKTFSKEICIEKYGEIDGVKCWKKRQDKWQKTLKEKTKEELLNINILKGSSISNFINQYGYENGIEYYCKYRINKNKSDKGLIEKTKRYIFDNSIIVDTDKFAEIFDNFKFLKYKKNGRASSQSLKYLIPLYKFCRKHLNMNRENIRLGVSGSKEFYIKKESKGFYSFDFSCISEKIIVEFNHLFWHPDPYILTKEQWDNWYHPKRLWSAAEKYKMDQDKIAFAKSNGYSIITIWHHLDLEEQLLKVKNFITCNIIPT